MAQLKEAKEHMSRGEKALQTSMLSLKFNPDNLTASMEFSQAASKFRACNQLADAISAWGRAAELKEKLHDLHGAGRAYESAGQIAEGGGSELAADVPVLWQKAVTCFRLAGKAEIAAKLILKLAVMHEKEGDIAKAKQDFEDAICVYKDDDKDYNLGDVYKQYIGFLVRSGDYEAALEATDGNIEVLTRQKQMPFVMKELLSKVVIILQMQDTVRAEEILNTCGAEGWFMSAECQAGSELVAAFQTMDAPGVSAAINQQVFNFLPIEIARLAKKLQIANCPPPRAAAAGDVGNGAVADRAPAEPEDLGSLLM